MGISYDCASSILLCAEDTTGLFGFDEEEDDEGNWSDWSLQTKSYGLFENFMVFPLQSDDCLGLLMEREVEHLPREDYTKRLTSGCLNVSIRTDAIDWIIKVHAYYNFGPLSAYLSVNYLDRFLSSYELPQGKTWMTQLLSVACLSLAAKMEEAVVPLLLDLQVAEAKFVFESRTIQRMELRVLSTLKWRMHAVTPFSFIEHFLRKLNGGDLPSQLLVHRALELILSTIKGIGFLPFKPSEIAAAAALWVTDEAQNPDIEKNISYCSKIDKERVLRCYEVIQEVMLNSAESADHKNWISSVTSMPQSPIGVLDAACLSYKSDQITSGSLPSSQHFSPAEKRRKISRPSIS